jgi:endo-1,4-beta-xylanase
LAGATDERIAVTNPNGSGIGGAGLNRLKGKGSERVESFYGSGNIFWFGQGWKDHRGRDGELPYDQHWLHSLVAPRGLLVTEGYEDFGANPAGTYAGLQASRKVWELLGAGGKVGWSFREGGHAHTLEDYVALLDFMDVHVHKKEVRRDFQRGLYPGLEGLVERV